MNVMVFFFFVYEMCQKKNPKQLISSPSRYNSGVAYSDLGLIVPSPAGMFIGRFQLVGFKCLLFSQRLVKFYLSLALLLLWSVLAEVAELNCEVYMQTVIGMIWLMRQVPPLPPIPLQ